MQQQARAWLPTVASPNQVATPASHRPHRHAPLAVGFSLLTTGSVLRKSFAPTLCAVLHTSIRRHGPTTPRCRATRAHTSGRTVARSAIQAVRAGGGARHVVVCCAGIRVIRLCYGSAMAQSNALRLKSVSSAVCPSVRAIGCLKKGLSNVSNRMSVIIVVCSCSSVFEVFEVPRLAEKNPEK